ncbi:hypothetical protein AAF712_003474 [Marasmius tenuissimus]|uniref:Nuclease Le1 n=1 Tax=Marasmius tenuissimus TaxID=585030 RepID=A0ABR3A709_9AGAR
MKVLAGTVLTFCYAFSPLPGAYAWGASGHQAVGYIAMQFLTPNALSFVQETLGSQYNRSLGVAATWADETRSNPAYAWSSPLHYVDALDNPPRTCNVNQTRDCTDGACVLTAIANYTIRVIDESLSATQTQEALKFLDHFIGDIGQPLHVENDAVGGNDISVKCSGSTSNLHSVWDSGLINRLLQTNYDNSVTNWVNTLVTRIKTGTYRSSAAGWISCSSTTQTEFSDDTATSGKLVRRAAPLACPLVWARESNALVCSYVFTYPQFSDLCSTNYYTGAVPLIETQIAKQGYRLAAWLNVLFDGRTGL